MRLQETGFGSIVQIWRMRDRQIARTLLNRRKQLRHSPSAIAGVLRAAYHDTASTKPLLVSAVLRGAAAPFAATARFAKVGNWTARRRQERVHHKPGAVMGLSERSASSLDTIARHAERVYSVAEGATPPLEIQAVSSSWQRSAKKHGLDPLDSQAPRILTPAELKHFREPLDMRRYFQGPRRE